MTADIEEHGESDLLSAVVTRIAEGEDPRDIARSRGYGWFVLRTWMEDSPERMEQWALAKRCFADGLAYESLMAARDATVEEVQVSRLKTEHYTKMAGKMSKQEWGDAKSGVVIEGLTMDEALGGFAGMLLEKMRVVEAAPIPVEGKEGPENLAPQKILLEDTETEWSQEVI